MVTVSQVATAIGGAAIGPAVTGMTLGIVRQKGFNAHQAIRREGDDVGFWRFLKVGVVTMIPALAAALGARLLIG